MSDDFTVHDVPVLVPRCPSDDVPLWIGDDGWECPDCAYICTWPDAQQKSA